jgi:hypothetical protein
MISKLRHALASAILVPIGILVGINLIVVGCAIWLADRISGDDYMGPM